MKNDKPGKAPFRGLGCLGLILLLGGGLYFHYSTSNLGRYNALTLGMTQDEIIHTMGREPDRVIRVQDGQILLFSDQVPIPDDFTVTSIDKPEDLPMMYSSIQVLIGPSQGLVAVAWIGEGRGISPDGRDIHMGFKDIPEQWYKK